jgi:hypothetical protein
MNRIADLVTTLDQFVNEARDLRTGIPTMPGTQAAPHEVHEYLLDVRRRLDRVEHLLATASRVRAHARRFAARDAQAAEDDWDDAVLKVRSAPVRRGDEFSSARERAAEANLASMTARRTARDSAENAALADECVEVLRLIHRGLDGVRHDTLTLLRLLQFESHLER